VLLRTAPAPVAPRAVCRGPKNQLISRELSITCVTSVIRQFAQRTTGGTAQHPVLSAFPDLQEGCAATNPEWKEEPHHRDTRRDIRRAVTEVARDDVAALALALPGAAATVRALPNEEGHPEQHDDYPERPAGHKQDPLVNRRGLGGQDSVMTCR
jgi:hypothetical protein